MVSEELNEEVGESGCGHLERRVTWSEPAPLACTVTQAHGLHIFRLWACAYSVSHDVDT